MLKYLEQGDFWNEKGCLWSIPSNNQYPVQPWYLYPNAPWFPKDWPPQNYTNGDFVQFVMKYAKKESKLYKGALQIIEYRLSIMDTLAEFLSFVKSDIEQGIEIHDWIKLIKCLQENKLKSEEECKELFTKLDAIIKKNAMDGVYQSSKKLIEQNDLGVEELDAMVEQIANGIWSEEGLKCENPEQRLKEIGSVGELWWPIYGLIDSIRILREHNRLE